MHSTFPKRAAVLSILTTVILLSGCSGPGGWGNSQNSAYSNPNPYSNSNPYANANSNSYSQGAMVSGYGVVQSIDTVAADNSGIGLGTFAGAVAGGLLGNQVGQGRGNTAATVAGVAGGALAGREVEKNMRGNAVAFRITLRMDDGSLQSVVQDRQPSVRVGEHVRVMNGAIVG